MVGLTPAALLVALAATTLGTVASPAVDELSGLTRSRADAGVLWGHNDTGDGPTLYRIGLQGEDLGRVAVPGALAHDWEDIAGFEDADGPALLVGDIGDNLGLRTVVTLYAVRDPGRGAEAQLLWQLDFDYPDGPHDCEALAVDPLRQEILLVTKRDTPPRVYRLPLPQGPPRHRQRAEFLGTLPPPPSVPLGERLADPIRAWFLHAPTAFDISADGLTAVIVTLGRAYVYRRQPGEDWAALFARGTEPIELPVLRQTEAAALSADGGVLWIGGEGRPGQWARIDLRETQPPGSIAGDPAPHIR